MERTVQRARRVSGLLRNYISLSGMALVVASTISILFLLFAELIGRTDNPYLGIFTYIIFPAFLILGLTIMTLGALVERRRRLRTDSSEVNAYPRIDLNDPVRRRRFLVFLGVTFVFLFVSAFGSFRAYEYTESVTFCGQLCHVMSPEFTTYQASPHARVRCVECHVGSGAGWYVRSKFSGARQLYAYTFDKYSKPVPTPVHNLRPATDTCEHCHWPQKFFGMQLKTFNRYGYDEANTPRQFRLMINTGGGNESTGVATGIHWHMNITNEITYISTDDQRQVIPWVRLKDKSGNITEYRAIGARLTPEEVAGAQKRKMDCVDCHNRPAHIYLPPDRTVNEALVAGRMDASLPYLKRQAVDVLSKSYASTDEAIGNIASSLDQFYRLTYPDVHAGKRDSIKEAIAEIQRIYRTYSFPEMKTDWQAHADNIGHFYSQGCFRCHDGQHVSPTGKIIRKDCNICHTVLDQAEGDARVAAQSGAFQHPVNLGNVQRFKCSECHTGKGLSFKHPVDLGDISQFKCSECHTEK
jgi:nitrate/TMAO reductase-like tetraheme cytochrome c subunit